MRCVGTYLCLSVVWSLTGWAQSAQQHSESHSSPKANSLLARSEMQVPRPLPIIKPLRFDEIPVGQDHDSIRPGAITPADQSQNLSITPADRPSNAVSPVVKTMQNIQANKTQ